jgi:hypothetical protein
MLVFVALMALTISGAGQGPVPPTLFRDAERGDVRIVVRVVVDTRAGQSIESAQEAVLKALAGTRYRLLRKFVNSPFLVLEAGPDALRALDGSPDVESVAPDFELHHPPLPSRP